MKKVLIIAYYFPPLGWSGVQRTVKFVKYLREFNWQPIVITVGKTTFSILDESLGDEIPEDIKIIRIDDMKLKTFTDRIKSEVKEYVKASFDIISDKNLLNRYEAQIEQNLEALRNLLLLPDGNAIWANNVIKELNKKINIDDMDIVYTTSSPYSAHLVGYYLKNNHNKAWVADFRDEWTNNPYYNNEFNIRYEVEKNIEKEILSNCDKVITISELAKNNYINSFKLDENKIKVITNGYDEEDFKLIYKSQTHSKFTIVHSGSFYSVRNPYTFINAINDLIEEKRLEVSDIIIEFIGEIDKKIKDKIMYIDKFHIIKIYNYTSHKESLELCTNANLLLLVIGQDEKVKSVYTGKIFEYLRLKKPILSLSPKESLVEELLNRTGCGFNVEYNDIESIQNVVLKYYNDWKNNKQLVVNEDEIKKYERKNLTKKLSQVFNSLLEE